MKLDNVCGCPRLVLDGYTPESVGGAPCNCRSRNAIDLIDMVGGGEQEHLTVPRLNAVQLLQQLADDLIGQCIVRTDRAGAMMSSSSRNRITGALARVRSKSCFTRFPL